MHPADLLFLAALLLTAFAAVRTVWWLLRGRRELARRTATLWVIGAASYLTLVVVTSVLQSGRTIALGEPECFDDWCIAVDGATSHDGQVDVTLRILNRGRGRAQAEPDAFVYLRDADGRINVPTAPVPIGERIAAGAERRMSATFQSASDLRTLGIVKARRARFPAIVIIGDAASLFHRPTIHALTASLSAP